MLVSAAAAALAGRSAAFVGIGLPNMAAAVARATVAPGLELVYESGILGAQPSRVAMSVGDPWLVSGASSVLSMTDLFGYVLQGGLVDVALVGAAQIGRDGSLNTTVVGRYDAPTTRLPGSGGACDIVLNARECFVMMRQSARSFVEEVDFCTSPSRRRRDAVSQDPAGRYGAGVTRVITDLGLYDFAGPEREMRLTHLQPGVSVDQALSESSAPIHLADRLGTVPPPSPAALRVMREDLDPHRVYLKG
jgi:glutaconate CoA-transferase subunit B